MTLGSGRGFPLLWLPMRCGRCYLLQVPSHFDGTQRERETHPRHSTKKLSHCQAYTWLLFSWRAIKKTTKQRKKSRGPGALLTSRKLIWMRVWSGEKRHAQFPSDTRLIIAQERCIIIIIILYILYTDTANGAFTSVRPPWLKAPLLLHYIECASEWARLSRVLSNDSFFTQTHGKARGGNAIVNYSFKRERFFHLKAHFYFVSIINIFLKNAAPRTLQNSWLINFCFYTRKICTEY